MVTIYIYMYMYIYIYIFYICILMVATSIPCFSIVFLGSTLSNIIFCSLLFHLIIINVGTLQLLPLSLIISKNSTVISGAKLSMNSRNRL